MFSVSLTIISSLIAYLKLSIAFVYMNIVCQRIRNDLMNDWCQRIQGKQRDVLNLTSRDASGLNLAEQVHGGANFVNDIVVTEDWRENFRISWSNVWKLSKLLQPHIESKTTRMRCLVDITKKVAWTLYYLSNRGCLRKTTNAFGLSHQVSSFQNHKESLQELRLTRQRSNLPTSTRQHIKSSRDIGELVLNPIQLIRT